MSEPTARDKSQGQPIAVSSPVANTSWLYKPWLLALVMVILAFVAYQPVWHAGFIWDDPDHLTDNPAVAAPSGLKMIWSSLAVSRYYPLTLTTFWIQRRFWGLNPMPYHLVNVLVHAANGVLLFLILRRLRIPAAWVVAMLWVLHPVNVESVAWITELKNTQSGLFFFLSILCFLRFEADEKQGWYALAVVCGLAAMLSKPSTVVLPLVLTLCVWWERPRLKRTDLVRITPFLVLAAGMSALTIIEQRGQVASAGLTQMHLRSTERLIVAGKAIWFYAFKVLWPARLAFVYSRWELDPSSLGSWVPTIVLAALGIILWRFRNRPACRAVLFGGGFFIVALLPVLGFFDVFYFRYSFVADHFQYLASVGIITLVCSGGWILCKRIASTSRYLDVVSVAILLTVLGTLTWRQAHAYQDSDTLWRDTETNSPDAWLPHYNRGHDLWQAGRVQEAIVEFKEALRIKPQNAVSHSDLGVAFAAIDKLPEAIEQDEEALKIKPGDATAHNDLGAAFAMSGRQREAIDQYEQALQIDPHYAQAHANLGLALLKAGRTTEAVEHYEEALRILPGDAKAHYNLGLALVQEGQLEDAINHFKQAVQIKPDYFEARFNLGLALEKTGRNPEAIKQYEQTLKLRPDFTAASNALARLQSAP